MGLPLSLTKGWAAPEVEQVYSRARELCAQIGDTPQLFPTLNGLFAFYLMRAEYKTALEAAKQLLSLAQRAENSGPLLEAHDGIGLNLMMLGEFVSAREHLEAGMAFYDPHHHCAHIALYGHDPGVVCLNYSAYVLGILGYPDQALETIHQALSLARQSSCPFSVAWALNMVSWVHQGPREGQAAQEQVEAGIALSTEQRFAYWSVWGTLLRGWARAVQEQAGEGVALIRQSLAAHLATGSGLAQSNPYPARRGPRESRPG